MNISHAISLHGISILLKGLASLRLLVDFQQNYVPFTKTLFYISSALKMTF